MARVRLSPAAACAGGLLLWACSPEVPPENVRPDVEVRLAWTGEDEDGLRVVAEGLPDHRDVWAEALLEEDVLRESLGLEPAVALLRLHLIGPPEELLGAGRISISEREVFSLPPPSPGREPARARLLRKGLVEGGPVPAGGGSELRRRTFLLSGAANFPDDEAELRWERGDRAVSLRPRLWKERERLDYLAPDLAREEP